MPVHEIRYKAWEGDTTTWWRRLLAIPKFSIMSVFNKWLAVSLFGVGSLQLLIYTMVLVITNNPELQKLMNLSSRSFEALILSPSEIIRRFLMVQVYFCLMTLLIAAPRIISQERAHKGLPLIYSRPIGRFGYIAGKFAALGIILSYLTLVQVLFLFLVMWTNYPEGHQFHEAFWSYSVPMLARAILQSLIIITAMGLLGLASSAASSDVRAATIVFIVLMFGASFVSQTAQNTFAPKFPELGIREVIFASNDKLLQSSEIAQPQRIRRGEFGRQVVWGQATDVTTTNVIVGLLVWSGAALLFMRWRLRPFDVHGA